LGIYLIPLQILIKINFKGYARGFRAPLYSRVIIQRTLFKAGCFVQRFAWLVIVSLLTLFTFCSIGLRYVHIETDIVKLWVSGFDNNKSNLNPFKTYFRRRSS